MKKLNFWHMLSLNAYYIGMSFMWNVIHPIMLPAVLRLMVDDSVKNSVLGILTTIGLLVAMVVQPISGAISDRWISRWGRRRPLITIGTLFDFIFLAMLAWAGGLTWVFIGYIGLQLSSNIAHGPLQGLLPDVTPPEQIGSASGMKTFIDFLVMAAASIVGGLLLDPNSTQPVLIMLIVIGLLAVSAAITILFTKEEPSLKKEGESIGKRLLEGFRIDFSKNRSYWFLIALRFICLFGIYGVQKFAQYFITDVLKPENPALETGIIMGALTLALVISAGISGWLNDRFSPRLMTILSAIVSAIGYVLLSTSRTRLELIGYGTILGIGMGVFLTTNWTLANLLAPQEESGKYVGLTNIATAGSSALGGLMGPLIDQFNKANPGEYQGYTFLFLVGAASALLCLVFLPWIKLPGISKKSSLPAL